MDTRVEARTADMVLFCRRSGRLSTVCRPKLVLRHHLGQRLLSLKRHVDLAQWNVYIFSSQERFLGLRTRPEMTQTDTPLSFDYGPARQKSADPLVEREYVKERLALAYRVIAHEQLCTFSGRWIR